MAAGTEDSAADAGASDGDELDAIAALLDSDGAGQATATGEAAPRSEDSAGSEAEAVPPGADADPSDDAPDYWLAEDKAAWREVPAHVRSLLRRYEQQRDVYNKRKVHEAAHARDEATRAAKAADTLVRQTAAWWQQHGPALNEAFASRWASVDWKGLAEKDPQEVARLIEQRQKEETLLTETRKRGEADAQVARSQGERALLAARHAEHAKLAERLPDFFGPDRAADTYGELAQFLAAKGIPPNRIATIYEAPIIELALAAMRFDKAQQALRQRDRRAGGSTGSSAKPTPMRIAPGPGQPPANRAGDALRQAGERFRQGGGASIADAAELIRLSGL